MAAAHGAVEVLAEQWTIRNIAYANLLKNRSFPGSTTQTATMVSFQSARPPPQSLADGVRKSSGKPTRGTASVPSDVHTDVMLHETPPFSNTRMIRCRKTLKQAEDSMQGLGLGRWLRIVKSDESRDREDSTSDANGTQNQSTITLVSKEHASGASHDTAGSLGNAARPSRRR